MKAFKEKAVKQKEHTNIYMLTTQGSKPTMPSPNLDLRFKSKTLLNKQNQQPNVPNKVQGSVVQNTFGAAKMMMRKSGDEFKAHLHNKNQEKVLTKQLLQTLKNSQQKFNFLSKSNNFERCLTERSMNSMNPFSKKHMKTEECDDDEAVPIIEDCEFINSEYGSSQNSCNEEKLHYAKSYQRPVNNSKNIIIYQSLNYDADRPRELVTFGPSQANSVKKYQISKDEQKKMRREAVNNMLMSTKAEVMRSCDFETVGSLVCVNHRNKKAKYRLNAVLTEEQQECFYCSKCAVNLAKQSFDIQEISPYDRKMIMCRQLQKQFIHKSAQFNSLHGQRQEQFANFQKRLQNLKIKLLAKLNLFNQKSEEVIKMDKKIEFTVSNYDNLIEILKEMRQQEMKKEEKLKKQKSLIMNSKKNELSTILDKIRNTATEINNERNKLMTLKNKEFSFVFDTYIKKLASYEEYLTNLQQTQFDEDIAMFEANIDSEVIDEEAIIHQIFDEMYKKLSKPKLVSLSHLTNESNSLRNGSRPNKINEIESGGSSMFYCEEDEQQSRPPFRILFQSTQTEVPIMSDTNNLNENFNVNSSIENPGYPNVRYFKEENYFPTFNHHQ